MNEKKSKEKSMGQVFTPSNIVNEMLDICSYCGEEYVDHFNDGLCPFCGHDAYEDEV